MVDGRTPTDDGRTDERRLDGYTISSHCERYGSGELKTYIRYTTAQADQHICISLHSLFSANNNSVFDYICDQHKLNELTS